MDAGPHRGRQDFMDLFVKSLPNLSSLRSRLFPVFSGVRFISVCPVQREVQDVFSLAQHKDCLSDLHVVFGPGIARNVSLPLQIRHLSTFPMPSFEDLGHGKLNLLVCQSVIRITICNYLNRFLVKDNISRKNEKFIEFSGPGFFKCDF